MGHRWGHRAGIGLILALTTMAALTGLATAGASPALASTFSNYVTKVSRVDPALPGVVATALANGESMTVSDTSSTPVIVEGYQKEPYLKITDHGVWENTLSPAVYLNKSQFIGNIPTDANPVQTPHWKQLTGGHQMTWHDHRIHWMGAAEPPMVAHDQKHAHLINTWSVPIVYGAQPAAVVGTLSWQPSSDLGKYLPYVVIVVALAIVVAVQLLVVRRRRRAA